MRQRGYYYGHWNDIEAQWVSKVENAIAELRELEVPQLPDVEDESIVTSGRGYGSSHALLVAYARLLESVDRVIQYHFELLNLGYVAYVGFYALCREAFPDVTDQAIASLLSGADLVPLRPDEELKALARLAIELGVADEVKAVSREDQLRIALARRATGVQWLSCLDATKDPWFYCSNGNGLASHHRSWIDDTTLPLATIASYIARLQAGEAISGPRDAVVAERDRVTAQYRALMPDRLRVTFDERLALARTVFSHVENHSFYVDHWYLTVFWNKVREFGAVLASRRFLAQTDEVFYLPTTSCARHYTSFGSRGALAMPASLWGRVTRGAHRIGNQEDPDRRSNSRRWPHRRRDGSRLALNPRQRGGSKTTSEAPKLWRHSQFSFGLSRRSVACGLATSIKEGRMRLPTTAARRMLLGTAMALVGFRSGGHACRRSPCRDGHRCLRVPDRHQDPNSSGWRHPVHP
jgi:hypothetical protein